MFLAAVNLAVIAVISLGAVAWLWCAFWVGATARSNGERYGLWLLIGFATGPLGVVIAYFYFRSTGERRRRTRHSVDRQSDIPMMMTCPNCHQSVPTSYDACQFCGCPLHDRHRR